MKALPELLARGEVDNFVRVEKISLRLLNLMLETVSHVSLQIATFVVALNLSETISAGLSCLNKRHERASRHWWPRDPRGLRGKPARTHWN